MHKVIVINRHRKLHLKYKRVYIGRGSVFGNPWPIREDMDRDTVCDLHRQLLKDEWKKAMGKGSTPSPLVVGILNLARRVESGEYIALECFCKPQRCHGDFIAEVINWYVNKD